MRCTSVFLEMLELGTMMVCPQASSMVVWRQVMSWTTPDTPPTSILSPGLMMPIKVTCMPPIRFESVSWKPREIAMPPTPRAATSAFALMPKQLSRIKLPPIIQMTARAMLMKILDAGSGLSSRLSRWFRVLDTTLAATAVPIAKMTAQMMLWTHRCSKK